MAELVAGRRPLSAAIGDAANLPGTYALAAQAAARLGAGFVKVGLRHFEELPQAVRFVRLLTEAVHEAVDEMIHETMTRLVVVGYADARRVGTLLPTQIPAVAAEGGAHVAMLDTAVKDGAGLWDWLTSREIEGFVRECHEYGLHAALAGALRADDLQRTAALGPDIIGVRGAACDGGRLGRVRAERVARLREALLRSQPR